MYETDQKDKICDVKNKVKTIFEELVNVYRSQCFHKIHTGAIQLKKVQECEQAQYEWRNKKPEIKHLMVLNHTEGLTSLFHQAINAIQGLWEHPEKKV